MKLLCPKQALGVPEQNAAICDSRIIYFFIFFTSWEGNAGRDGESKTPELI